MTLTEMLKAANLELQDIRKEKYKGFVLCSRAEQVDEGEKATKIFFFSRKRNYVKKMVNRIQGTDRKLIVKKNQIPQEITDFYKLEAHRPQSSAVL